MVTVRLAVLASGPRLQVTVPPEWVQVGLPGVAEAKVTWGGRSSVSTTPVAWEGPWLVTWSW